jgi:hypothetical protein
MSIDLLYNYPKINARFQDKPDRSKIQSAGIADDQMDS